MDFWIGLVTKADTSPDFANSAPVRIESIAESAFSAPGSPALTRAGKLIRNTGSACAKTARASLGCRMTLIGSSSFRSDAELLTQAGSCSKKNE